MAHFPKAFSETLEERKLDLASSPSRVKKRSSLRSAISCLRVWVSSTPIRADATGAWASLISKILVFLKRLGEIATRIGFEPLKLLALHTGNDRTRR
jgi:hypothetical protein